MVILSIRGKEKLINYVMVPREGGGVGKICTYPYLGEEGQTHSYVIFSKSIFYIRNSSGLAGIIFHLRLEGKKSITMFYKE